MSDLEYLNYLRLCSDTIRKEYEVIIKKARASNVHRFGTANDIHSSVIKSYEKWVKRVNSEIDYLEHAINMEMLNKNPFKSNG